MTILFFGFLTLFTFLCVVLCGLILIQESKSMGLGSSFGVDSGDSVFGVSTPDILKKITAWLAVAFCISCLLLSFATTYLGERSLETETAVHSEDHTFSAPDPMEGKVAE
ncbi:preprotein translocase, SecG subunit [Chlamydia ibidis]|uniref:Protein-export membrane protein SecG n=2 Tax=Chlamydia ibidis TaxID=1405396 RepID=S7J1W3_9CHLA|nr:preprotein translocase subunit SecG [Chlamydia ibidis]EPP34399.1 preprotein translocase, SecG subunit [Chlamydia ibidis]EQM63124.1 preprotein translocase, SecG subunit [Chlamydia ibidis 10-1398/6]